MVARKSGTVTFADDGVAGYRTDLITPMSDDTTVGGYMGVRLDAVTIDGTQYCLEDYVNHVRRNYGEMGDVVVVPDTGAVSYFTTDDTGVVVETDGETRWSPGFFEYLADVKQVENDGFGLDAKVYGLNFREEDGSSFNITIPVQWRSKFFGRSAILDKPFRTQNPKSRANIIVVGNMFLQAVAITYSMTPGNMAVTLSHLNARGQRVPQSHVPPDAVPAAEIDEQIPPDLRPGWTKDGYVDEGLDPVALTPGAIVPGAPPPPSNVTLDMFFMAPTGRGFGAVSRETRDANMLSYPSVRYSVGGTDIIAVVDTGSGVTLTVQDIGAGTAVQEDRAKKGPCSRCGNAEGCKIKDVLGSYMPEPFSPTCDPQCSPCCKTCCLPAGKNADDTVRCAVLYCTGALSYTPTFRMFDFGVEHLRQVEHFVGRASTLCLPAPDVSILGCWRWNNPIKGKRTSGTFPYWMLRSIGQYGRELDNMTLSFWREDLLEAPTTTPQAIQVDCRSSRWLRWIKDKRVLAIVAVLIGAILYFLLRKDRIILPPPVYRVRSNFAKS